MKLRSAFPYWHWGLVFLSGLACLLCVRLVIFALIYLVAAMWSRMPWPGVAGAFKIYARESACLLVEYLLIQPLGVFHYRRDAVDEDRAGPPILFVHGYMCDGSMWWWFRRCFAKSGLTNTWSISLDPVVGGIESFARQLQQRTQEIHAATGQRVTIIAHSMGGLVSRRCVVDDQGDTIARVVTLGTPHTGTAIAYFAIGICGLNMWPNSRWIRRLERLEDGRNGSQDSEESSSDSVERSDGVEWVSLYSQHDEVIIPFSNSELPGAKIHVIDGAGHMALVFDPRVIEFCRALCGE